MGLLAPLCMSYVQQQAASYYLGALEQDANNAILRGGVNLSFMDFDTVGTSMTFDSTSFAPDSASTATSLSTGYKTYSGSINVDETGTIAYEAITEQVKEQLGYKVGVISSVNLNHATPAAYYGHNASRSNYYDLGVELVESGFDYFSGGALLKPTGADDDQTSLYTLAEAAGYMVVMTQAEAESVTAADGKVIIIDENLADGDAMAYEIDRTDDMWSLADHVAKGIEVLDNDTGFFMMVESGKIDWACHANDVASTIYDVLAFDDAIQEAVNFYNEHPSETLIVVTGDHETGGLTIGAAGTKYDLFLENLANQTISQAKFDDDYVDAVYIPNQTSFADVMADIETLFGLVAPGGTATADELVLTDYEVAQLQAAYDITVLGQEATTCDQETYETYGGHVRYFLDSHRRENRRACHFKLGYDVLALSAISGSLIGTMVTLVLSLIFTSEFNLHGALMTNSESLLYAGYSYLDLTSIFMASIFIGASGAVMDLAVDITASVNEVVEKKPDITADITAIEAMKSGMNVGRAAMGTMTTTLLLAYSGSYVAQLMVFMAQGTPLDNILNYKYVSAEILHTLAGSFGLVSVAPLTAICAGFLLTRKVRLSAT